MSTTADPPSLGFDSRLSGCLLSNPKGLGGGGPRPSSSLDEYASSSAAENLIEVDRATAVRAGAGSVEEWSDASADERRFMGRDEGPSCEDGAGASPIVDEEVLLCWMVDVLGGHHHQATSCYCSWHSVAPHCFLDATKAAFARALYEELNCPDVFPAASPNGFSRDLSQDLVVESLCHLNGTRIFNERFFREGYGPGPSGALPYTQDGGN